MGKDWTEADIPDLTGRTAIVTGANTGLGLETARALAEHGATVVLAVRNLEKGQAALASIRARRKDARVSLHALDLSSLESVRRAAGELAAAHERIDLLVNNAGVMYTPQSRTADGFELQLGTNHLGHFAFTGLLLHRLLAAAGARVVTVSSLGHRIRSEIDLADLHFEKGYGRVAAYGRSKLANLLFTYELQRRFERAGADGGRARGASRRIRHRAHAQPAGVRPRPRAAADAARPVAGDGRAAAAAGGHRPGRGRRPVLWSGRVRGDPGAIRSSSGRARARTTPVCRARSGRRRKS